MKLKELLSLISDLAQNKISKPYIVGGTVREKVLGQLDKISDLDITTGDDTVKILAQQLANKLGQQYKIDTQIMKDGHLSIFMGDLKVDFSSNFRVPNIQQLLQNQGIAHPTDMQQEIYSRDFTCNALLMDFDLKTILDPTHSGIKDIKAKTIRTCLSPEITLSSNKNRVIRAIYLAAKLGFEISEDIIEWVKQHPSSVQIASSRVLHKKLNEALEYDANKTAELLGAMNLWDYVPITTQLLPWYQKRAQ